MVALAQAFVELRADPAGSDLERDVVSASTKAGDKGGSVLRRLLGDVKPTFGNIAPAAERASTEAGHKAGARFGTSFAERAKHAFETGLFAGLGYQALRGIEDVFRSGADEAKATSAANAALTNSLQAMGVQARITGKFTDGVATSIADVGAYTVPAVKQMETLLATFPHIDTSRPIFRRAAVDVGDFARRFTDGNLQTAVIQVGKALDDPIKGMTALHRVGVSFTSDQTALIKKLQESGQGLAAQQEIFKALEPQIKGAAAAYGTSLPGELGKAGNAIHEIEGQIVTAFAPAAVRLLTPLVEGLKEHAPEIQHYASVIAGDLITVGHAIGDTIGFVVAHKDVFLPLAGGLVTLWAAFKGYTIIKDVTLALEGLSHVGVVGLLITLVGAFVTAWETSARFRSIVTTVFHDVEHVVGDVVAFILHAFKDWADVWFTVVGAMVHGAEKAFGWVPGVGGKLKGAAREFDSFRDSVDAALSGAASDASQWGAQGGANFANNFISNSQKGFKAVYENLAQVEGKLKTNNDVNPAITGLLGDPSNPGNRRAEMDAQAAKAFAPVLAAVSSTTRAFLTTGKFITPTVVTGRGAGAGIGDATTGGDFGSPGPGGASSAAKAATDWANKFTTTLNAATRQGIPAVRAASARLQQEVLKGLAGDPAQRQKMLALLSKDTTKALNTATAAARAKATTLGVTITKELADALDTGSAKVTSVLASIASKITATLDGPGQGKERDQLLAMLKARADGLRSVADQITGLKNQAQTATDQLSALTSEASSFQSSLAATLKQGADLGAAWSSGQGLESSLGNQLTLLTAFKGTLDSLKAAGLGDAAQTQIASLGPLQGQQIGLGILAAGDATKVGSLVDQINNLADSIAAKETTDIYSPQLDTANANLVSIENRLASLEKTIAGIAKPIGNTTAQALTGVGGKSVTKAKTPAPRKRHSIK